MERLLYGVTTAMVTPFDLSGQVDYAGLRQLTGFLIEGGVHCLYPCGTTGEMFKLTTEERKRIAETVVTAAKGRVVVYIHTGAPCAADTSELSLHAAKIGADGVGVVTPAFFGLDDRAAVAYYKDLAAKLPEDFPIYLYNIPQCSGNDLSATAVREIAALCPNVVGIKYSWPDLLRSYEYLQARPQGFDVVQGTDRLFLSSLAMGCSGIVSGVSNVYPEVFVRLYQAWQEKDIDRARLWQSLVVEVCNILRCGADISVFKHGLAHRGLPLYQVRGPQLDLTGEQQQALSAQLKVFDRKLAAV